MEKLLSELSKLSVEELRIAIDKMHPIDADEIYNILFTTKVINDKLDTIKGLPVVMTVGTEEY